MVKIMAIAGGQNKGKKIGVVVWGSEINCDGRNSGMESIRVIAKIDFQIEGRSFAP
jgi:hypothetical protein